MNLQNFRFETDADGIALLTWDMPDRSMNVITLDVMHELEQVIDTVASDAAIKGCVIASGKESVLRRRRSFDAADMSARISPKARKRAGRRGR